MAILKEMFKEEKERLLKMKKFYINKIQGLPKGSIVFKNRGNRRYPYLVYRIGEKVKTDYLKVNADELKEIEFRINKRKKYTKLVKDINDDLRVLGRF
jgi:hypothetical protein